MSVQLIVYPQSYEGFYNVISTSPSEVLVNGISFTNLDSSTSYDSPDTLNIPLDVLTNAPPVIVNTWYRFRSIGSGTPNLPVVLAGDLVLNSTTTQTLSGIYQKLSNLTIGSQYTFIIDISTTASDGFIVLSAFNGTNIITQTIFSPALSQITHTFTAASTEDTIIISYSNNVSNSVTISNASVQPVIGAIPSGATNVLNNGQVICDLYEDEDLPLTLSVDDFKNVAEKVQSYSKAFNLPSTKRNNRIFNTIFEVTRSNDGVIFNPYKRTQCVLKQDGFILFEGFLRLLDVTDKGGEISYNVNLYSEVIALADTLKDKAFRDLDFTELEHAYNRTQITRSWNDGSAGQTTPITWTNSGTSGFRTNFETLKYPFVDWNHQILIGPGTSGTAANPDNPRYTALEQIFRPFISIKYLIDRIFEATPFTYSSGFFDTTDFEKLYMDFNWGGDNTPVTSSGSGIGSPDAAQLATTSYQTILAPSNNFGTSVGYSVGVYTASQDSQTYNITYNLPYGVISSTAWTFTFRWRWVHASTGFIEYINETSFTGSGNLIPPPFAFITGTLSEILMSGDTLTPEFKCIDAPATEVSTIYGGSIATVIVNTSSNAITSSSILQTLRGELGQWDFLKGLITMFNLVTLVDEDNPNNIIIEPYSDVFIPTATAGNTLANRGIEHDWTDKIDVSEMKLTPLTDLNKKTMFKFVEDDDDYSFTNYKNLVGGHLYGSQKYNAGNEFNILEGEDEIVAEPFAATVVKPLMSQYPEFITPAIYARGGDATWEGFENSPRIMFNNGIKPTGASYYIPEQNGVTSSNETNYLQFSHLTDIPTITSSPPLVTDTRDFNFGICQLITGVGAATPNNLF